MMEFYVGQKLKFKEAFDSIRYYEAGEAVVVVGFDCDGDPIIEGEAGLDYFYSEDLADLVFDAE